MSEVIPFQRTVKPTRPPKKKRTSTQARAHMEEFLLRCCADWHVQRFEQKKYWANTDLETLFGTNDERVEANLDALGEMAKREEILAMARPYTTLGAKELLKVCLAILEEREAELCTAELPYMAQGPVREILRNVISSIDYAPHETRIGPKNHCQL